MNIPLIIMGVLLFFVLSTVLKSIMISSIYSQYENQAKIIANSIDQFILVTDNKDSLDRLLKMIGAERNIRHIYIAIGDPLTIASGTNSHIIGEKIKNLNWEVNFDKFYTNNFNKFYFYPQKGLIDYFSATRFRFKNDLTDEAALLVIGLDVTNALINIHKSIFLVQIIILISFSLLVLITFVTNKKIIIDPLFKIIHAISLRKNGIYKDVELKSFDEISEVAQNYNELVNSLTASEKKAKIAAAAKTAFLSNMSHEIRTPLMAIMGNAEILVEKLPKQKFAEEHDMLERIIFNGDHLMQLINDILDFSKIDAKKLKIDNKVLKINNLIAGLYKTFSELYRKKDIKFAINVATSVPKVICADEIRLRQILINLLSNALKFTNNNGCVSLEIYNDADFLFFKVIDNGIGISESAISSLFLEFMQADISKTKKYGGTGLGLSISKHLCKLMGGDLVCNSKLNEGSTFIASININNSCSLLNAGSVDVNDEHKSAVHLNKDAVKVRKNLKDLKVLIAEDSLDNQKIISWHLTKLGISFDIANNGQEATELALINNYDLILMDVQMPVLDGISATKKIKALKNTVIVALTANAIKEQVEMYQNVGFDDFMAKPFKSKEFRQMLSKHLF